MSEVKLIAEHLTRQAEIIPLENIENAPPITIIGAGAIGGWLTLALAKMGLTKLTVFDFDKVEIENMNAQLYRFSDIGKPKVEALKELVHDFTEITIDAINDKYTGGKPFEGIVITALDNMEARKAIWEAHKGTLICSHILDPRMGAETALMYVARPIDVDDQRDYEATLLSDDDSVQERCTAKATIYTANLLSGLVAKAVKDLITGAPYPRLVQWDIPTMQINAFFEGEKK